MVQDVSEQLQQGMSDKLVRRQRRTEEDGGGQRRTEEDGGGQRGTGGTFWDNRTPEDRHDIT